MSLLSGKGITNGVIVKWNDQTGYIFVSDEGKFVRLTTQGGIRAVCWGEVESFNQSYVDTLKKVHTEISPEAFNRVYDEIMKELEDLQLTYNPPPAWEQMKIPGVAETI